MTVSVGMICVTVTDGADWVMVDGVTPAQLHALLNRADPEQAEAYAGTAVGWMVFAVPVAWRLL